MMTPKQILKASLVLDDERGQPHRQQSIPTPVLLISHNSGCTALPTPQEHALLAPFASSHSALLIICLRSSLLKT